MRVVHQLLSGAGPHDAITTEAGVIRRHLSEWGWGGADYAYRIHPALDAPFRPGSALTPADDDVVLLHHSAGWPQLESVLALPGRKLLMYHNVTPAAWFWIDMPGLAVQCQVGRDQLRPLVTAADLTAAVSAFNASELTALGARDTRVIPLLMDTDWLGNQASGGAVGCGHDSPDEGVLPTSPGDPRAPRVLFVGRLSPHKRQDEVIRAFGLYRRVHAPAARLTLVGDPISPGYLQRLRDLAEVHAPGAVDIESGLAPAQLARRYREADVFLCLSEHEGFCIPLVEAFSFGVPVIARPFGAIPEVAADAALMVPDPDPTVIAELLHLVINDGELRAELIRRGRARLSAFAPAQVAPRLRDAVLAVSAVAR